MTAETRRSGLGLLLARLLTFVLPVLVIAGGIGSVVVMGALKPKPEKKEEAAKATSVLVARAEASEIKLSVDAQGEVSPRAQINLTPQAGGRIAGLSSEFVEGGAFKAGDVLVEIESVDYALAVTRSRAQVAQAQRALEREEAETALAASDWAELGEGEDASALALRQPQLAEARAAVAAAQAALRNAELDLARTKITAPFDGRVASKTVDIGQFVTPGQPLGEIFSTEVMEIRLPLSDRELSRLDLGVAFRASETKPGPKVTLSAIVAGRAQEWTGRITRTASRYDPSTRLLFAIAEVERPYDLTLHDEPLAPGLFVDARIEGRALSNAIVLPRTALRGESEAYVVSAENTLEIRTINVASTSRDSIVVIEGVKPGERVVVSPLRGAAAGMAVTPVDPSAPAATPDLESAEPDDDAEAAKAAKADERTDASEKAEGESESETRQAALTND